MNRRPASPRAVAKPSASTATPRPPAAPPARYRTVLLLGAPGSGKGTQGRILGTVPGFHHCACGDVFRGLRHNTDLGRVFLAYSSRGELVPDAPTVALWRQHIEGAIQSGSFQPATDLLVLDGIPRNVAQAEMLRDTLAIRAILYLTCRDLDRMVERLQRRALKENRLDDANLDVIRSRLETYTRETEPLVAFYGPKLVRHVDAMQSPLEVLRDVLDVVADL